MSNHRQSFRLGDYLTELPKSNLPASVAEKDGAYPFYCSSTKPKMASTWLLDMPAIMMGTGGLASIHLAKGRYAYSTDTWAFVIKESDQLTQSFVYRLLEQSLSKIDFVGFEGSGLRHLRKGYIKNIEISAPDRASQEKITNIFDCIDKAIDGTENLIAKYKKINDGLINDFFTRGLLRSGKLRPPREESPSLYRETEVGWIPKEWEVVCMGSLAEERSGATVIGPFGSDLVSSDYRLEGVPVVFVRDVKEYGFQWKSDIYVSKNKAQQLNAHSVRPGEILATKMGLPPCVSCVYPIWMPNGVITADLIRLSPDRRKVDPTWLVAAINHDRVMREVAGITAGVTRPKVTLADFRKIRVAKPQLDEQQYVISRLNLSQEKINHEQARVMKLQNQKRGLMLDLLSGFYDVKEPKELS